MKTKIFFLLTIIILLLSSCLDNHLITDDGYRAEVNAKYLDRKECFSGSDIDLFSVLNTDLTTKETEALKFLFAYMPLSDITDYSGRFFLDNVRLALKTREQTKWGKSIPENIFLHYVLPVRVNNENLDSFRIAYYDEIIDRLANCGSAEEAALELNHWCHEKVSYQAADIRTSAPMATILSARGRCGEESTFAVAALRTAGIPARQIYTPRWAHSDDNHAWVEVWLDGDWKYLGACEPEPVLSRGWFTEPARRAMLTHTKAFGLYRGDENTIKTEENYAEINTLSAYARTKVIVIKVLDAYDNAVENARVETCIYNYAEFYPLAEIMTDHEGLCKFETGLGDLLIWASKKEDFGFEKVSVAEIDTVKIKLGSHADLKDYYEFDLQAPVKHIPYPDTISQESKMLNAERLKKEDSIRQAYIDTWMDDRAASDLALSLSLDSSRIKKIITRSMGNYEEIAGFLRKVSPENHETALQLLEIIADKDLRDTKAQVLEDHLLNVGKYGKQDNVPEDIFINYVLNPRISYEIITPWRSFILSHFDTLDPVSFIESPYILADLIREKVKLVDDMNYYNVPVSPEGVLKTALSDLHSLEILFIACCRTYGLPARFEPGTKTVQFYGDDRWKDVYFSGSGHEEMKDASLEFSFSGGVPVPEYYIHFTLARFEKGRYISLDYDYNRKVTEFDDSLSLPSGQYMLVTGNRTDESTVLASLRFFTLLPGERKTVDIELRKQEKAAAVLGEIDLNRAIEYDAKEVKLDSYAERGLILLWIDHEREPSKHVLKDLSLVKSELDQLGCRIIFLSEPSPESASFKPDQIEGLPENTIIALDKDLGILKSVRSDSASSVQLPLVLYADKEGKIYYMSEGYRIGIGEQILKTINKIK
ncbi:MAG: transglutaminase-like domain-containing protein [Bacteroidales bacterium]|nr:transglutaminase-like domain-containing protein [Bacteroidales bacterium]